VVVPPGEVFSFIEHLGEVVDALGYEDSYIIFGDRTELGPGGGVCQVSTTAFRAAFFAGFPILERWAHTYRVGWYEPPLGLDATVFVPTVDLKFRNDLSSHLLIQTEVDTKEGILTFRFYGRKPDRSVEMEGPIEENPTPAPPPVHEEDPTLPRGMKKRVERAREGVDVTVQRIIKEGGEVVKREKFVSHYKPWPARYLVGTREEAEPTPSAKAE
jgi:vancomycin resistance protein YoaR